MSYTLAGYRTSIRAKARDSASDFWDSDTLLDEEINNALLEITRETRCLKAVATCDSEADVLEYDIPSDFMLAESLEVDDEEYALLATREEWKRYTTNAAYIWGTTMSLYPTPTAIGAENIKLWYIYSPEALSEATDASPLPTEYQALVIPYVLWQYFMTYTAESTMAQRWEQEYAQRLGAMKRDSNKRVQGHTLVSCRWMNADDGEDDE